MNWLCRFLFWGWGRLFLGRREWEVLDRAISLARKEIILSGQTPYDARTKHLLSYARVRKELGDPLILTGAIIHIAVAVAYLEGKRQPERIF